MKYYSMMETFQLFRTVYEETFPKTHLKILTKKVMLLCMNAALAASAWGFYNIPTKLYYKSYWILNISAQYASPITPNYCSLKNLARRLFMPNRSDTVWKQALMTICGTIICPYVLLPVNLYFICRGICFPLYHGQNFSLARSDSCFCAFSPLLCTTGNPFSCLCFRFASLSVLHVVILFISIDFAWDPLAHVATA